MAKATVSYNAVIEKVFFDGYRHGEMEFGFERRALKDAATALGLDEAANLGDVIYSYRYRRSLPESILATQPDGYEWIIEGAGRGRYRFRLVTMTRIVPRSDLVVVDIPDATPEMIRAYRMDDEQALLAMVRYNRLIDTFLDLAACALRCLGRQLRCRLLPTLDGRRVSRHVADERVTQGIFNQGLVHPLRKTGLRELGKASVQFERARAHIRRQITPVVELRCQSETGWTNRIQPTQGVKRPQLDQNNQRGKVLLLV